MKKFLVLALAFMGFVGTTNAQSLRVEAGINSETYVPSIKSFEFNELPLRAEAAMEFDVIDLSLLSIESNLYMSFGGTYLRQVSDPAKLGPEFDQVLSKLVEVSAVGVKGDGEAKLYSSSVKVPLNIGFRLNFADNFNLALEGGAYAKFGLTGEVGRQGVKERINLDKLGDKVKEEFITKRHYGLNASAAVEMYSLYLRAGIEYGLTDKLDFDKKIKENLDTVMPLLEKVDENRINVFITVGYRL